MMLHGRALCVRAHAQLSSAPFVCIGGSSRLWSISIIQYLITKYAPRIKDVELLRKVVER